MPDGYPDGAVGVTAVEPDDVTVRDVVRRSEGIEPALEQIDDGINARRGQNAVRGPHGRVGGEQGSDPGGVPFVHDEAVENREFTYGSA